MRLVLAAAMACCVLTTQPASGEHAFPYRAFVNGNDVYVRSGPGQSYYPTDKLKVGQEVEIYRHDPGGWYAIRPAEESFTWVSARYVEPTEGNLAVVIKENVAARVGSRFSDIREVIQVRLHKGEVVELLDTKTTETGAGAEKERWYKIAPPSGEFRWVFGKFVDPEYPRDGLRRTQPGESVAAKSGAAAAGTAARHHRPGAGDGDAPAWGTAAGPAGRDRERVPEPAVVHIPPSATAAPRGMSPAEFQAELEAIDMELSVMVVEEPTVWSFDAIRQRADLLLNQAETALERGRARVLVNKIARFIDLKQRYGAVAAMREENRQLARLSPQVRTAGRSIDLDGRFDAVGRLTEIVAPKIGAPRYALVDEKGDVRCYVSPAPGVSLRAYVGRQVGINGTRGYMPEQRAQHLMARHVSMVEDGAVR